MFYGKKLSKKYYHFTNYKNKFIFINKKTLLSKNLFFSFRISANDIVDFIQSIINYEKEFDSNQNAIDNQNDFPVYHRINNLLDRFIASIGEIDLQQRLCFRSFALSILQFEITMAALVGKLLMKLAQNKENLEEILTIFQQYLPAVYFEYILIKLASNLSANDGSYPFIQQLSLDGKFQIALWFINEKKINHYLFLTYLKIMYLIRQVLIDNNVKVFCIK